MNDGLKGTHRQAMIDILLANPRVERAVLFGSRRWARSRRVRMWTSPCSATR